MLKDRVDVLARDQKITAKRVDGVAEYVVASGVPCRIVTQSASRLATALGAEPRSETKMYLGPSPALREGWAIIPRQNRQIRYTVVSVQQFPSPHKVDFQVATLQVDVSTTERGA